VSTSGITLSSRHVDAIQKLFPQPKKVIEVQRFLGLTNYFRKFIKDYAVKAKPLNNLLRKSATFNFDKDCQQAFKQLKQDLTAFPVLRLYNPLLSRNVRE